MNRFELLPSYRLLDLLLEPADQLILVWRIELDEGGELLPRPLDLTGFQVTRHEQRTYRNTGRVGMQRLAAVGEGAVEFSLKRQQPDE